MKDICSDELLIVKKLMMQARWQKKVDRESELWVRYTPPPPPCKFGVYVCGYVFFFLALGPTK